MKRAGFTMVELIFVIVIIGILAAVALPKFNGVKEKAKINSELSAMSGFDGAITAAIEFREDDYGDTNVSWYDFSAADMTGQVDFASVGAIFKKANDEKSVLKHIGKKVDSFKIVSFIPMNSNGNIWVYNDLYHAPIAITGIASDKNLGVKYPTDHDGQDIPGKPDKNDFWVFNPTQVDLNITGTNINPIIAESGTITLVDVNGTTNQTTYAGIFFSSPGYNNGNSNVGWRHDGL